MRRIFTLLLLSLFLSVGSVEVFADRHDKGGPRQEQKYNRKDNRNHGKNHNKGNKGKFDKNKPGKGHDMRPGVSHGPKHNMGHNPDMGPGPRQIHHRPTPPPPAPPRLPHMVNYMTRGCHDVNVWQIDDDTYIVKYRKGNRFYTRRFYPYANRYDSPSLISVNWQPMSPWTLIPPIQLNINL